MEPPTYSHDPICIMQMAPLLASPPAPSKKRKRTAQQAIADRQDDPEAGEADGLLDLAAAAEPVDVSNSGECWHGLRCSKKGRAGCNLMKGIVCLQREYKGIPRFKLGENLNTVEAYWNEYVRWHGVRCGALPADPALATHSSLPLKQRPSICD